jgi:hypothetical protein
VKKNQANARLCSEALLDFFFFDTLYLDNRPMLRLNLTRNSQGFARGGFAGVPFSKYGQSWLIEATTLNETTAKGAWAREVGKLFGKTGKDPGNFLCCGAGI